VAVHPIVVDLETAVVESGTAVSFAARHRTWAGSRATPGEPVGSLLSSQPDESTSALPTAPEPGPADTTVAPGFVVQPATRERERERERESISIRRVPTGMIVLTKMAEGNSGRWPPARK